MFSFTIFTFFLDPGEMKQPQNVEKASPDTEREQDLRKDGGKTFTNIIWKRLMQRSCSTECSESNSKDSLSAYPEVISVSLNAGDRDQNHIENGHQ